MVEDLPVALRQHEDASVHGAGLADMAVWLAAMAVRVTAMAVRLAAMAVWLAAIAVWLAAVAVWLAAVAGRRSALECVECDHEDPEGQLPAPSAHGGWSSPAWPPALPVWIRPKLLRVHFLPLLAAEPHARGHLSRVHRAAVNRWARTHGAT